MPDATLPSAQQTRLAGEIAARPPPRFGNNCQIPFRSSFYGRSPGAASSGPGSIGPSHEYRVSSVPDESAPPSTHPVQPLHRSLGSVGVEDGGDADVFLRTHSTNPNGVGPSPWRPTLPDAIFVKPGSKILAGLET